MRAGLSRQVSLGSVSPAISAPTEPAENSQPSRGVVVGQPELAGAVDDQQTQDGAAGQADAVTKGRAERTSSTNE
ncbi:MAG: hypothetical protein M3425_11605 [Actinomycetota bacterium]|nr:hypothetical protein [Euzebyales bacterium]MDQ3342408.1 hypothetical protein [Actinomycetota bacterium]MDQ3530567.1 hypothetical protein [Actinomycetota bacterium]